MKNQQEIRNDMHRLTLAAHINNIDYGLRLGERLLGDEALADIHDLIEPTQTKVAVTREQACAQYRETFPEFADYDDEAITAKCNTLISDVVAVRDMIRDIGAATHMRGGAVGDCGLCPKCDLRVARYLVSQGVAVAPW